LFLMETIKEKLAEICKQVDVLYQEANALVANKKVRVISNYNGQPIGTSRKALTGNILTAQSFDPRFGCLYTNKERVGMRLSDFEIVEEVDK